MKGSVTFLGMSLAHSTGIEDSKLTPAAVAAASQRAGLPQKVLQALQLQGVRLPAAVTPELAASADFFSQAHEHRLSAGLWVRGSALQAVLLLFLQQHQAE